MGTSDRWEGKVNQLLEASSLFCRSWKQLFGRDVCQHSSTDWNVRVLDSLSTTRSLAQAPKGETSRPKPWLRTRELSRMQLDGSFVWRCCCWIAYSVWRCCWIAYSSEFMGLVGKTLRRDEIAANDSLFHRVQHSFSYHRIMHFCCRVLVDNCTVCQYFVCAPAACPWKKIFWSSSAVTILFGEVETQILFLECAKVIAEGVCIFVGGLKHKIHGIHFSFLWRSECNGGLLVSPELLEKKPKKQNTHAQAKCCWYIHVYKEWLANVFIQLNESQSKRAPTGVMSIKLDPGKFEITSNDNCSSPEFTSKLVTKWLHIYVCTTPAVGTCSELLTAKQWHPQWHAPFPFHSLQRIKRPVEPRGHWYRFTST